MQNPYVNALSTPVPQGRAENDLQKANNAGGFSFTVSDKTRLERFLILGTDGGTYYVNEKDLTKQSADFLVDLIKRDPVLVIDTVRDVSVGGRAYRNSPAIFATAMIMKVLGKNPILRTATDPRTPTAKPGTHITLYESRRELSAMARELVSQVCRTSTHLFEFCQYLELLGGWSRARRTAVAGWYGTKNLKDLAYQAVKYRNRAGWTHADVLRLSHARIDPTVERFVRRWYKDEQNIGTIVDERPELDIIRAFQVVQEQTNVRDVLRVLDQDYAKNLPWEALPTQFLKDPEIWKKLFENGQIRGQALVRNVTRLARIGAFSDMVFARQYANLLVDEIMIAKTRLHPINYLNALIVHEQGQINRGNLPRALLEGKLRTKDWNTVPVIKDALNEGFHLAFKHIEPANKRTFIALDTSGSMWWNSSVCNGLDISAATAAAAMSMTTARTEPYYQVCAFSHELKHLGITPKMGLSEIEREMLDSGGGGGTDCSLPMLHALKNKIEVDTFAVYTDNETWAGHIHPHVALEQYRQKMGIDAKLVVVGVAATEFTIADPRDRGMLDVIGFDSSAPKVIADFSAGRF